MMLTQKAPTSRMDGQVVDAFAGQKRISGGSSDTDVTELAAIPTGPRPPCVVITVTPVGRCPSTRLNASPVISIVAVSAEQPESARPVNRSGAVAYPELAIQRAHMLFYRVMGKVHMVGDLQVRRAIGEVVENLALPWAERDRRLFGIGNEQRPAKRDRRDYPRQIVRRPPLRDESRRPDRPRVATRHSSRP